MALEVFPELPGLQFGTNMTPSFNNRVSKSTNGHEVRNSFQEEPLWLFELSYEWLPNRKEGRRDLETIVSFFLKRNGSYESFLYKAPETPPEDMLLLGVGDGVRTRFNLLKNTKGYVETAGGIEVSTDAQIYTSGGLVNWNEFILEDHRTIVFDTPPELGVPIMGCYIPLYRVRFEEDSASFSQFMTKLWELQQLNLQSIFA